MNSAATPAKPKRTRAAKKPKDKPSWTLKSAIRKQWNITDENFNELMRLSGRQTSNN